MSVRRRAIKARVEREARRAKQNANFREFFDALQGLLARKQAAGETSITHAEIHEATRHTMPGRVMTCCYDCASLEERMQQMIACPTCGNKRCPRGTSHLRKCTGSNEPGQEGSRYDIPQPPLPGGEK
jgi:hypothetical protein